MNQSVLYVAAMIAFFNGMNNAIQLVISIYYHNGDRGGIIISGILSVILVVGLGLVLYGRYLANGGSAVKESAFNRDEVLSVLGIIAMTAGCVWAASEMGFVLQVVRMRMEIDLRIVERLLPSVVLVAFGVYYGIVKKRKCAQQVDAAEASTKAVPPSKPSGSPR